MTDRIEFDVPQVYPECRRCTWLIEAKKQALVVASEHHQALSFTASITCLPDRNNVIRSMATDLRINFQKPIASIEPLIHLQSPVCPGAMMKSNRIEDAEEYLIEK